MGRPDASSREFAISLERTIAEIEPYDPKYFEHVYREAYERRFGELQTRRELFEADRKDELARFDEEVLSRSARGVCRPTSELESLEAANALDAGQQVELDAQRARAAACGQAELDYVTITVDTRRDPWGFGPVREAAGEPESSIAPGEPGRRSPSAFKPPAGDEN